MRAPTDIADAKVIARKDAFARRRTAHDAQNGAAEGLRDHLLGSRHLTGARIISAYRPIRTEIDPTPLMESLCDAGHRVAVPVIIGEGQPLEFHEWWPGAPMKDGAFGAEIPVEARLLVPDLVLLPMLAFDRHGWRLGYGGGFYDRTLQVLRRSRRVRAIGLAYAAQQIEAVPIEHTDERLDAIATETGILRPRMENDR
ncbi:MAG: 5-formyltetrahydrofolate cyclo-ligase [Pseudomonadota bacterium]